MQAEIEQRIRAVYPTGRLEEPDNKQYYNRAYDGRLWKILAKVTKQTAIQLDSDWTRSRGQENCYSFTLDADPCVLE